MNPLFKVIHERVSDGARVTSRYRGPSKGEVREYLDGTISNEWFIYSMIEVHPDNAEPADLVPPAPGVEQRP